MLALSSVFWWPRRNGEGEGKNKEQRKVFFESSLKRSAQVGRRYRPGESQSGWFSPADRWRRPGTSAAEVAGLHPGGPAQIKNVATRGGLQGIEGGGGGGTAALRSRFWKFIFNQEVNRPDVGISSRGERGRFELNRICELIYIYCFLGQKNLFAFVTVVVDFFFFSCSGRKMNLNSLGEKKKKNVVLEADSTRNSVTQSCELVEPTD